MKIILLLSVLLSVFTGCQQKRKEGLSHKSVKIETDNVYDKLVKIRRDFHANPELAGNEKRTQNIIKQYLLDLGIEVETDIYGYSVVGILKGKGSEKAIAWRVDMDALPSDFPDQVEFKSTIKGILHGCGHDVHLAIGLGIAEVLARNKESIEGTIYFIFQPEEETFVGAKNMISHGLFSRIHPDEIYGLHVTALPIGQIMVKPKEMFAYQKRIRVMLKNELSEKEARELAGKIHHSLSRLKMNSKPWEIQHIDDPEIGLMNPNTIFKDYLIIDGNFSIYSEKDELFLEAYLYEMDQSNLKKIIPEIEHVIEEEKYKEKLLSISFIQENPTVMNDEELTERAMKILSEIYGNDLIVRDYGQVPYFNDDFAYFQQTVPGVYFFLGGSDSEKGIVAMNHAPNFNVDEESIRIGVRSFSSLIIERLKEKQY
ncbi:M20/M25/M40 family metallo-hydrolase [Fulvivirgaceae bacterium PWU5]|uniref:M20/M25/M40 family metallo-hydrolase n=1 Tax=Dawidia cretensis TaxID=2782350 RepID=A0AAP2DVL1_9BACT|nr:M20/M25/M40 family metallo-hydrolase [Dawidia cretensis]MBT1708410.1 M20/M25/M40 family metallo-hydrolase [Dawidia cretensis]